MRLTVDPDKHLIQVPAQLRIGAMMKASFPDLAGEHRSEPVPPEPNRLVADIDPPLVEQILDLPQRKRIADVHHHREADHLGRRVEIAEGILHRRTLKKRDRSLKPCLLYTSPSPRDRTRSRM